jgi:hypothetical protein
MSPRQVVAKEVTAKLSRKLGDLIAKRGKEDIANKM